MKNEEYSQFYFNLIYEFHCFIIRVSVSIAKAHSSLSSPSIIISLHYRTISHSSLWPLSLSFKPPEPRLGPQVVPLGIQSLPARVSNTFLLFYNISYNIIMRINVSSIDNSYEKSENHLLRLNHFNASFLTTLKNKKRD